ncbi:MAG TPA: ABC transporter permease [Acidimicrobiia bacterium]|nr:ABC transporter permease [Acidimicrobiia bacterium]
MLRRYVVARILAGVVGIIVFLTAVFFGTRLLVPGDFADNFAVGGNPGDAARVREALALDRPVWQQYLIWLGRTFSLDLGQNPRGQPVIDQLLDALPWTLTMFAIGLGAAFLIGSRIGRWAGWRKKSLTPTTLGAATFTSVFPPWLVFLAFYTALNLFGFSRFNDLTALDFYLWRQGPPQDSILWQMMGTALILVGLAAAAIRLLPLKWKAGARRASLFLVPLLTMWWWSQLGIFVYAQDLLGFLAMPVLVLFMLSIGDIVLVIAASMDGLSDSDFVVTARAKGLTDRQVRNRHAGRVALLPALSRLTANLPFALGGLVIVEASFARLGGYRIPVPGVASVLFGSLRERDLMVTMGGLVVVGVITLLLRIVLDLIVVKLDPRIQLEKVVVRA